MDQLSKPGGVQFTPEQQRELLEAYQQTLVIHRDTFWLGRRIKKTPTDAWIYQELIYKTYPDLIIETGTGFGGSALFLASICDLLGHGRVVTIDIQNREPLEHPRVKKIIGSSIEESTIKQIGINPDERVMIVLDSLHSYDYVLDEMRLFGPMVKHPNLYMVVEDSYMPGVRAAIASFMIENEGDFIVDRKCEKFGLTFTPGGYLRRAEL